MDTLSRILDLIHFDSSFYYATSFHSPWSIEIPAYRNVARFHYVSRGSCWVRIDDEEPRLLSAGDIIIVPHGASQVISDTPDREPIALEKAYEEAGYDGEGLFSFGEPSSANDTQLVCGHFEFEEGFRHPLVDQLPKYILGNENDGTGFAWVKDTLRFMSHSANTQCEGSSAIVKRLSEVIFIQAIQYWQCPGESGNRFLAALNDPQLSLGLKAFHDDYSANWSVDSLASVSCMSRSLFAERFRQYLDVSPMQYVTNWRMQNARQMLADENLSIDRIAGSVGYESTAAFSKAFKRTIGRNPGEYRRSLLARS